MSTECVRALLALLTLAAVTGCPAPPLAVEGGADVEPLGPDATPPDALSPAALRDAWLAAYCAFRTRCSGQSEDACLAERTPFGAQATEHFHALQLEADRGRLAIDAQAMEACFASAAHSSCEGPVFAGPDCERAVRPLGGLGARCSLSDACPADLYCRLVEGCEGVCAVPRAVGQRCFFDNGPVGCVGEATCEGSVCVAAPTTCADGLSCPIGSRCEADGCVESDVGDPLASGDPCSIRQMTVSAGLPRDARLEIGPASPPCETGLSCIRSDGAWICGPVAADGACSVDRPCLADQDCLLGRCVDRAGRGEPCDRDRRCAPLLTCTDGRCEHAPLDERPCETADDCGDARCNSGLCVGRYAQCTRYLRPGKCEEDADCPAQPEHAVVWCVDDLTECLHRPAGLTARLVDPRQPQVPEVLDLLRDTNGRAAFVLHMDREAPWLAFADVAGEGAHPALPGYTLGGGQGGVLPRVGDEGRSAVALIEDMVVSEGALHRPSDDPCLWTPDGLPLPTSVSFFYSPWPTLTRVEFTILVPDGDDTEIEGVSLTTLLEERGVDREWTGTDWRLIIGWDVELIDGPSAAPTTFARDAPVDVCAP